MKSFFLAVRVLLYLLVFVDAVGAEVEKEHSNVFLSLPSFEEKVGVAFDPDEVEMIALYRGNNLYLRPLSRKLRLLLGKEKAVATKLSLPEMVRDEASRGSSANPTLLISERPFGKPTDTFLLNVKGKVISGRFPESRGDRAKMGILLFLRKGGIRTYQFSVEENGVDVCFHTLTERQYKAAKKSVEEKLKAAGQKKAAKKVGDL